MTKEPREGRHQKANSRTSTPRAGKAVIKESPAIVQGFLPPREILLEFIADNPDRSNKREIAKAFGLKGEARVELRDLLRDLEDEGLLQKSRKGLARPGALPPMTLLDITTRTTDGQLIARPSEWPEDAALRRPFWCGNPRMRAARARRLLPTSATGCSQRSSRPRKKAAPAYTARVVKIIDKLKNAALGVIRVLPDGDARLMPIDRRGEEMQISRQDLGDAKDGDLIEADVVRGRFGLPRAKVLTVVGSVATEKAISMIAIYAMAFRMCSRRR